MAEAAAPDACGSVGNLGFVFRLAHQGFRHALTDALVPFELTVPLYGVLSAFDSAPEMSSADLARRAAVTPQTMNALVHQLIKRGLLERRSHSTHARVIVLRLSRPGRRLLNQATPAVRAVERAAFDESTDDDVRVIGRWLAWVGTRFPPSVASDAPGMQSFGKAK